MVSYLAILLAAAPAPEPELTGRWMMTYYKRPEPARIGAWIKEMQRTGRITAENTRAVFAGFLAAAMQRNPRRVVEWLEVGRAFTPEERDALYRAAWLSGTPQGRAYLKKVRPQETLEPAPDLHALPVKHPSDLDFSWAVFFASGDPRAIRRVVRGLAYAPYAGALERYSEARRSEADWDSALKDTIFRAARWSIESNCRQDPEVARICRQLLKGGRLSKVEAQALEPLVPKR